MTADPHDYFVNWMIVGEKQYDGNVKHVGTYSIEGNAFKGYEDYREYLNDHGFVWEELKKENEQFGFAYITKS